MAERLSLLFDRAVDASLHEQQTDKLDDQLNAYLEDAHALEVQAIELLSKGAKVAGADELVAAFDEHLAETREHARLIDERLRVRGASPSAIKDAALRMGALNWGAFFASSRIRRSSSRGSPTPTSTSRSRATSCSAGLPGLPATMTPRWSPSGSSPRSGPQLRSSMICSTSRLMPRCASRSSASEEHVTAAAARRLGPRTRSTAQNPTSLCLPSHSGHRPKAPRYEQTPGPSSRPHVIAQTWPLGPGGQFAPETRWVVQLYAASGETNSLRLPVKLQRRFPRGTSAAARTD